MIEFTLSGWCVSVHSQICNLLLDLREEFGLTYLFISHNLSLMTAAKWLKDFDDIETLIRRADWIKPERFRKIVADNADILRRNLQLVTIDTSHKVELEKNKIPDFAEIINFLEEMEMKKSLFALRKFAQDQYQISI